MRALNASVGRRKALQRGRGGRGQARSMLPRKKIGGGKYLEREGHGGGGGGLYINKRKS